MSRVNVYMYMDIGQDGPGFWICAQSELYFAQQNYVKTIKCNKTKFPEWQLKTCYDYMECNILVFFICQFYFDLNILLIPIKFTWRLSHDNSFTEKHIFCKTNCLFSLMLAAFLTNWGDNRCKAWPIEAYNTAGQATIFVIFFVK